MVDHSINMWVLLLVFFLGVVVINTKTQCVKDSDCMSKSPLVNWSVHISVILVILCLALFGYDLALWTKLIKR